MYISARISKLIHGGFHQLFATMTTVMSPSKQKGTNNWYFLHLDVSRSYWNVTITCMSSVSCLRTYLHLPQSSWLIVLGHDWKHVSCVNNKINEQSAFKKRPFRKQNGLVLLLMAGRVNLNWWNGTSFHTFLLVQKAHVTREGWRLVTIKLKQQTFKQHGGMASQVIYFLIEFSESTKRSFSEPNEIFQCFWGVSVS